MRDNGIGMTRDEVLENIGTIARSGTKEFVQSLTGDQSKDSNLIGQFGVGFYSVFMVGDRVTLTSRNAGAPAGEGVRWESDGNGQFTLETVEDAPRGTEIVIQLKDDAAEYADGHRLRTIINKYSDHISLPIRMPELDGDKKKDSFETVNKGSALWARSKSEITQGDYNTFYKTLSYDSDPPLATIHNQVEAGVHIAVLHPLAGAVRPVEPGEPARGEAVRPPGVHRGRRRAPDAELSALRARHRGFRRPAVERRAGIPAAQQGHRQDQGGLGQENPE